MCSLVKWAEMSGLREKRPWVRMLSPVPGVAGARQVTGGEKAAYWGEGAGRPWREAARGSSATHVAFPRPTWSGEHARIAGIPAVTAVSFS